MTDTLPAYNMDKPNVDLSFLNDKERAVILKVIKADLELKKTTLGYLKKAIEVGRQFQLTQKSAEDTRGTCACCGQLFRTFCDRKRAAQCQQCQHLICKLCKREQGGSVSCVLCIKERLYTLQSMDYQPVFHHNGMHSSSTGNDEADSPAVQPLYGSDLLKECLETARKQLQTTSASDDRRPRSFTLPIIQPLARNFLKGTTKQERAQSFQTTSIPSINDPNSGFKIIKQATSEENMIDFCSLYSEPCDPEDYDIHGEIKLGVWYKTEENTLYVRVVKAKDLSAANKDGTSDPYVKIYLLPGMGKLSKRRTTIQRLTTKPVFNEILKYGRLNQEEIRGKTLLVRMSDWDRFGRNQFLGEVHLPLSSLDLTDSTDKWYTLQKMEKTNELNTSGNKGKLLLSLMFEPYGANSLDRAGKKRTLGKLIILVKQAEDLRPSDMNAQINPFARCYLLPTRLIDSKKKSRVFINTLNPVWNSEIEYPHVSLEDLESSRALEVTIWDRDRRGVNEFIGGIRLGPDPLACSDSTEWMDSIGDEVTHWEAALSRPGEWVEQWHNLRPSMSSLNQNAKKKRSRLFPAMYNKALSKSTTSIASAMSVDYMSPVTWLGNFSKVSKTLPASTSVKKTNTDTLKSLSMKRPPRGNYIIRGEILVTVEYKDETLLVHIDRAVKIAAANKNGTSDSYVKTYLLPDRTKPSKRKTKVHKRTTDPVYNTTLTYEVPSVDDLTGRALWLTIWHTSKLTSNSFLGEACIPLVTLDLDNPSEQWYTLHDFTESGIILPDGHGLPGDDEEDNEDEELSTNSPISTLPSERGMSLSQSTKSKSNSPPPQTVQYPMIPAISIEDYEETQAQQESPEPKLTLSNITQSKDNNSEDSIIPVATTTEVKAEIHFNGD